MTRRDLIYSAMGIMLAPATLLNSAQAQQAVPNRTQWKVRASEGFDAIAFLGPLSGGELYTRYYAEEIRAFAPRLAPAVLKDISELWGEAQKEGFGLLGPNLCVLLSTGGNDATVASVLTALDDPDKRILPTYKASRYWSATDWAFFTKALPRLRTIFSSLQAADFAGFRLDSTRDSLLQRIADVQRALVHFDVITLQERVTGRAFDPAIEVVLLRFCKPHGIRVQGQTFLQSLDYDTETTVRIAAHEMLHPPVAMDGASAKAVLDTLSRDGLLTRIVHDHDPRWGYTTLEGLLNEDLCQALDQLISEQLGVGRNPADRWRKSDDGIHVLAAGIYGLFRQDKWIDKGGSLEHWLAEKNRVGAFSPESFHAVAARVLERPVDHLWPLA
ncbi:MAG TPA: hypothetical protein VM865_06400 [Acidobacteriaceae bacterium]|jgi:hypothetical protein|nr:hypothetical protein [Acidobacteriaceae bacterium]